MRKRVLILGDIPDDADRLLARRFTVRWLKGTPTLSRVIREAADCHGLLSLLGYRIDENVFRRASRLECIAHFGVGYDNIDVKAARRRGIVVTNTPEVLTDATADIAWTLILACARRAPEGERVVREGRFMGWHPRMLLGVDLRGATLGIYGFGRIGQAVARRAIGWEMRVIYHQRHRVPPVVERTLQARRVGFGELLRRSDILSLHAPLTSETRGRFGRVEFRRMKRGAIFINTARGAMHDEGALADALRDGRLFSAGLDVYEREPRVDPDLRRLDRCVLLPHLGSGTVGTRRKMALLAARNIDRVLTGRPPLTPVPEGLRRPLRAPAGPTTSST
jgi:glyoxylate reductase